MQDNAEAGGTAEKEYSLSKVQKFPTSKTLNMLCLMQPGSTEVRGRGEAFDHSTHSAASEEDVEGAGKQQDFEIVSREVC